ncbi:SPFH domain-containing protein [Nitrospirillum amazonense]|uniref:Putative membrane protein YqiK n=1 Tax=Nitrospirillum amazonense TaxID=28077 RepID=A0A560K203_9PROT|nr:SPFH domain-containing protein [Nitrospirillum amazonense]MDG3443815.1 SPFH domain-containing protein [Nitrospirillum amazonense]TWB77375.1 putative membrane protein YqiK [Nitrospirillum amazonense]
MLEFPSWALTTLYLVGGVLGVLILAFLTGTIVYIRNDAVGIVEKLWALGGSVEEGFLALAGEAGFRPETLRGGFHFFMPLQYRVHRANLVTVPQGSLAYIFARGGQALPNAQALARWPAGVGVENARAFVSQGGQRGPQRRILREGVYAINTAQFIVFTESATHAVVLGDASDARAVETMREMIEERNGFRPLIIRDHEDAVGVVTVHDGPALDHGEIIAPTVGTHAADGATFHNSFQDPETFLAAGGRRGRQEQVLVEGTYYINRLFATIEVRPKTQVEIGNVGVVVSFTGPRGTDVSGTDHKHGELVQQGQRGVWQTALHPGKYAINPYAVKVSTVPTTNFVLRWIEGRSEAHGFDDNLAEIKLITKDAFEPVLPLSIVVHIGYDDAPWVVQQFADIKKLVEQTLDPMVSAWFKDAAQSRTLIELVNQRAEVQREALAAMTGRFAKYRLNVKEVMIGTPRAAKGDTHIDTIFEQLRARQVAREKVETYESQQVAAAKELELRAAEARAAAQGDLTKSSVSIEVAQNHGRAELARKTQEAEATKVMAEATAMRTRTEGRAEADRVAAIGDANAQAAKAQVDAFGGAEMALSKEVAAMLSGAITQAKVPLVPTVAMGGGEAGHGTLVDALISLLMAQGGLDQLVKQRGKQPETAA